MNDLLGNVKSTGDVQLTINDGPGTGTAATAASSTADASMQDFFAQVEDIKRDMADIRCYQREFTDLNEKGKTLVKTKDVHEHREAMQVGHGHEH